MSTNDLIDTLSKLQSEAANPETHDLDQLTTLELVTKLNQQDQQVPVAISEILDEIARAVDLIAECIANRGRLIYIGAGTSGRLGVLDAVECVPTFSVKPDVVIGLLAGGKDAMFEAQEGSEDDPMKGQYDLQDIQLSARDILVGIAASGRTPYVIGGLNYARQIGAKTIAVSSNQNAEIAELADLALLPQVGPEPLAGSTRMKSGTAQKLILNILSTAAMVKLGKVYKNLMVDVKATNQKLRARGIRMVMQVTGVDESTAESTLLQADMKVKLAILMLLTDIDAIEAENRLQQADGMLRKALAKK